MEESLSEPGLMARRAVPLVVLAFACQALALVLAWWTVGNDLGGVATSEGVGLWHGGAGLARGWAVWATAALAVLPLPILFVRVAARSWTHEPASWRRDILVAAGLVAAGLASIALWPIEGGVWDRAEYPVGPGASDTLVVTQAPDAGWWMALVSFALLSWAWRWSRRS